VPERDSVRGQRAPAARGQRGPDAGAPTARVTIRLSNPGPLVMRLARALEARGHAVVDAPAGGAYTWMVGPGEEPSTAELAAEGDTGRGDRILVLGWNGVHPDARSPMLHQLWRLEERCRGSGLATLALRLGPLVGATSPLWRMLAHAPLPRRLASKLVHPVTEADVIETVHRALTGAAAWVGWHELGGLDVLSLGELAELARAAGPERGGAWEPDRAALAEQRLIEPEPWARWAGVTPRSVIESGAWAA